ncbi:MAG: class I SAM-dependent methyltransferase [Alphaproteobacteria bacterium]
MADHDKTTPAPAQTRSEPAAKSQRAEIDAFVQRARTLAPPTEAGKRGRLIFALDATMSRQPTWDTACKLQGEMFREAGSIGGLDVQLVYFRGLNECRASRWVSDGAGLGDLMARINCMGGHTQIRKVLQQARAEADRAKVAALVYVGDAMEEGIDDLAAAAGELGLRGIAAFMFHEGHDPVAEQAFREIARLTRGAYCRFDLSAAHELGELLRAAAVYAAGGVKALTAQRSESARKLLAQMR